MKATDVLRDPSWLPVALAPGTKNVVFQQFGEGAVADSTFLDGRAKGVSSERVQVPVLEVVKYAEGISRENPINELFHISHVGSTLLAKVVQSVPSSISYREPTIFRELVNLIYAFEKGANNFYARELPLFIKSTYALFNRGTEDHVFIKHTSGNLVLPPHFDEKVTKITVTKRDAYLYTSAKDFLSHATKSQGLFGDAINGGPRRVAYFNRLACFRALELADMKPLEKVALVWVTEMQKLICRTAGTFDQKVINFDACLRENGKVGIVDVLCRAYDLDDHRDTLLESPAWDSNSKNDKPFDLNARVEALDTNYLANKIPVEKAITWIKEVCHENVNFSPLLPYIE